jgi:hypothetical protein
MKLDLEDEGYTCFLIPFFSWFKRVRHKIKQSKPNQHFCIQQVQDETEIY